MNTLKQTIKFFTIALVIGLTATSCNKDKYPDLEDGLYAEFVTTNGVMVAKLNYDKAPVTVANFVSLAEGTNTKVDTAYTGKKFYNGVTFHRVIDKFMIQGGDPTATGAGNPGYKFIDEINEAKHDKPGILSMANSGPATNGSQFFITEGPTPNLDPKHTVFGELVMGLEIQDSISNVKVAPGSNKPLVDVVINELNIIRKGADAKQFDAPKVFDDHFVIIEQEKKEKEAIIAKARESFAKENTALKAKAIAFPSGIAITKIVDAKGVKPTTEDTALVNYAGYLEDGTLFDSNLIDIAKSYGMYSEAFEQQGRYMPLQQIFNTKARLVPGFREALLSMTVGDKIRVYIPSELGWGPRGGGPIPPNANVIFDIELAGIKDK